MMKSVAISTALSLGLLAAHDLAPAQAADMAPLFSQSDDSEVEPPQQFTFGTGWYLRGDLTGSDDREPNLLGKLPGSSATKRDWGYGVGGGVGYKFNDYLRADLTGDYLSKQRATDPLFDGLSLHRFDGLVNGYIDLGNWSGLIPYVGAGAGFGGLQVNGTVVYGARPDEKFSGKTRYEFAWAAMAGVAYHLTPNLLFDVGYRYLDLGTYQVATGAFTPFASKTDLTSHEVRAGLRYMIY